MRRRSRSVQKCLLLIAAIMLLAAPARAQNRERVTFASLDPGLRAPLSASLVRPSGDGPFPAMVLLHTCGGVGLHEDQWAKWFAEHGYLALGVDSFAPRGVRNVCAGGDPTMRTRALDAYGALAYLRGRSDVVPTRVGAIGWSHGGGTVIWTDNAAFLAQLGTRAPAGGPFRAGVALYPACQNFRAVRDTTMPLLLLAGSLDDWTPPGSCDDAVRNLAHANGPITYHVYEGATHAWDNSADRGVVHIGTHYYTLTYSEAATADAHQRIADFLADALK